jgi:hypothetical protein
VVLDGQHFVTLCSVYAHFQRKSFVDRQGVTDTVDKGDKDGLAPHGKHADHAAAVRQWRCLRSLDIFDDLHILLVVAYLCMLVALPPLCPFLSSAFSLSTSVADQIVVLTV